MAWLKAFAEMIALAVLLWLLGLVSGHPVTGTSFTFTIAFAALVNSHRKPRPAAVGAVL